MIKADNKNVMLHIISDTRQMLDKTLLPQMYNMSLDFENKLISIEVPQLNVIISCPATENELDYIKESAAGEDLHVINIMRKAEWIKDTKVSNFILMHDINKKYEIYSIERLSNLFSEPSLDIKHSESHILKIEALFQVLRTNGGSIDTIAKFYNMDGFYILEECKLSIEPTGFTVNQTLHNAEISKFKDTTEFTPEGIILNNLSLKYPAIIKYTGKVIKI